MDARTVWSALSGSSLVPGQARHNPRLSDTAAVAAPKKRGRVLTALGLVEVGAAALQRTSAMFTLTARRTT
jgi:hypothetical protein